MLLLSPFGPKARALPPNSLPNATALSAAISDEVLIPFASPGSKTEALALDLLKSGKRVYTFSDRPGPLLAAGMTVVAPEFFISGPAVFAPNGTPASEGLKS